MHRVKAVTDDGEGALTLVFLRHNDEMGWSKIESFKILKLGETVS